jgi:hypothetical protein
MVAAMEVAVAVTGVTAIIIKDDEEVRVKEDEVVDHRLTHLEVEEVTMTTTMMAGVVVVVLPRVSVGVEVQEIQKMVEREWEKMQIKKPTAMYQVQATALDL